MNTDVEDLLREGMERFTAELRAPAGITSLITQRRHRRLVLRSAAGAGAVLAAGAAALAAVILPGAQVAPAAYVVDRVNSALSAAEPGSIAQMTITTRSTGFPGGKTVTTTGEEWSYGDQWRSVTNSSTGQPVYDEGYSASSVYTVVNYQTRDWARQSGLGRPAASLSSTSGCKLVLATNPLLFRPGLPGIGFAAASLSPAYASTVPMPSVSSSPATVARALRTAVSCGTLTVTGRQGVNGVDAIKLTSRPGSPIPETIWVSPGTYLPVRAVVDSPSGLPAVQETANITWLTPTAQNLANLTVPIPSGFHHVSLAAAVKPNLRQILGIPLPKSGPLPNGKTFCQTQTPAVRPLKGGPSASGSAPAARPAFSCPTGSPSPSLSTP
jgi:hypothetical protein